MWEYVLAAVTIPTLQSSSEAVYPEHDYAARNEEQNAQHLCCAEIHFKVRGQNICSVKTESCQTHLKNILRDFTLMVRGSMFPGAMY